MDSVKHSQFELFPGGSQHDQEEGFKAPLFKNLTVTSENIIVLCIILIMVTVLAFSLGVERGKRLAGVEPTAVLAGSNGLAGIIQKSDAEQPVENSAEAITTVTIPVPAVIQEQKATGSAPVERNIKEGQYTIQVASFKQESYAKKEVESLEKKGFQAFVVPKGNYSIVCVGAFDQHQEAKRYSGKLSGRYKDYLVRRL